MKNIFRNNISLIAVLLIVFHSTAQQSKPGKSGYAPVNGSKIYYEVYGEGKPIVLLHGSFMTIGLNWGELIPQLSKNRKVIALEMDGHGHSPLSNREFSYDSLASDVINALKYLGVESTDVIGYSFGGTIAYAIATQYPKLVNRLVIISSTYRYDGWQKEVRDVLHSMKPEFFTNTPLKAEYDKVAPDPNKWNAFVTKMLALDKKEFNLGDDNIKNIKSPVLLIAGDNDGVDKQILFETYRLLGGGVFADMTGVPKSQLAIIPAQGHVSLMNQTQTILQFLNGFLN